MLSATRGSRRMLRTFWKPSTVLTSTCSPSVSAQVWVSWGEPSGLVVAMKHGLGLRSSSSRASGSAMRVILATPGWSTSVIVTNLDYTNRGGPDVGHRTDHLHRQTGRH